MKLKKLLFSLLIGGVSVALPNVVNAASLEMPRIQNIAGMNEYNVVLKFTEEETVTKVTVGGCKLDNYDVSCVITPKDGISYSKEGDNYIFTGELSNEMVLATVKMTSESGVPQSYKFNINTASIDEEDVSAALTGTSTIKAKTTQKALSKDARLKSVTLSNKEAQMSPDFSADVYDYTIYNLSDTVNSIKFIPECQEGSCSVQITGGASVSNKTVTLNQGSNTVRLTVSSEDYNSSKTYTFTVYRGATSYNSAKLASLSLGEYTLSPAFDKDTTTYSVTIPNKVVSLNNILTYEAEDTNIKPEVTGTEDLIVGENKVIIKVTNANKDTTVTYTINVTRMGEKDIQIVRYHDGEVTYKDSTGEQSTIKEEEFKNQFPEDYEKIKNNEYNFDKDGYVVLEQPKEVKEDEPKNEEKKDNTLLIVLLIIGGLAIIGVSAYFIFFKKKKEDPKDQNKDNKEDKKEEVVEEVREADSLEEALEATKEIETTDVEIDETGIEEEIIESRKEEDTVSVDAALEDLMRTKQYDFEDKE